MKYIFTILLMLITNYGAAQSPVFVDSLEDAVALSESSKKDLLVVFSANWCKNCIALKDQLLYSNEIGFKNSIICIVDYDKRYDLVKEYKVYKIPDSRLMRNNIEISKLIGYNNKDKYKKWLNDARK